MTALERQVGTPGSATYFRSLHWIYRLAILAGLGGAFYLYIIDFDSFSETQLVRLSPLWFLSFHFGMSGLHAERAVRVILSGQASTFSEALVIGLGEAAFLQRVIVLLVFTPPFLVFQLNKMSSPLLISAVTTLIWGVMLYLFFLGIFPNL